MPNGNVHRLVAAISIGTICAHSEARRQERTLRPLAGAVLAAGATNLPDILEPACHPNHRGMFHSLAVAGALGWAAYRLYKWEPESDFDEIVRFVLLVGAGAYLIHLLLDATTAKSLPLIGRL